LLNNDLDIMGSKRRTKQKPARTRHTNIRRFTVDVQKGIYRPTYTPLHLPHRAPAVNALKRTFVCLLFEQAFVLFTSLPNNLPTLKVHTKTNGQLKVIVLILFCAFPNDSPVDVLDDLANVACSRLRNSCSAYSELTTRVDMGRYPAKNEWPT
jgi:hypothetical protein